MPLHDLVVRYNADRVQLAVPLGCEWSTSIEERAESNGLPYLGNGHAREQRGRPVSRTSSSFTALFTVKNTGTNPDTYDLYCDGSLHVACISVFSDDHNAVSESTGQRNDHLSHHIDNREAAPGSGSQPRVRTP